MKPPILITGCARSGTSMVAGVMNLCGAFGGKVSGATSNNQKGMFENSRIRNTIVKPHLKSIGIDPMGQYPLPDLKDIRIPINWRKRVERVILDEGYQEGDWMYKGAKMCLTWVIWHYAFPSAKWIIVRRRTADIVNSCMKTGFMRAFVNQGIQKQVGAKNEREGWLWWVHQHEQRFREMIETGLNVKVVWPERMVNGNYEQMKEAVEWAGLTWNSQKVMEFIEPKLWKAKKRMKG